MKKKARRRLKKRAKQLVKELRKVVDHDDLAKPAITAGAAAAVAALDRALRSSSTTLGESVTVWLQERIGDATGSKLGEAH